MKRKYVLPMILLALLLAGCNVDRNQEASPPENATQDPPVVTPEIPVPQLDHEFIISDTLNKEAIMESYRQNQLGTAESMAQLYVDATKSGLDLAKDENGIEMFDLIFDRQTLVVNNLRPADHMPDGYRCDIMGSGTNGDQIVPLFIIFQEDDPRFFCPLSQYGKQSRRSVETYLKYLFEGDAAVLSKWLSIDGGSDDFLDEANRLIEHYQQYDLNHFEIVNFDYDVETERFVYLVEDGNKAQFEILMSYGDGFSMPDIYSVLD